MKNVIYATLITVGTGLAALLGGWDAGLKTLTICMILDYILGMTAAGIFKKSKKTKSGRLESRAGWKGLLRKGAELAVVIVGQQIDLLMGTTYVRDAVCIGFIVNESVSILENAGLIGVPIPGALKKAIELLASGKEADKGSKDGADPDTAALSLDTGKGGKRHGDLG